VIRVFRNHLALDPNFDIDFNTAFPTGPARPHGIEMKWRSRRRSGVQVLTGRRLVLVEARVRRVEAPRCPGARGIGLGAKSTLSGRAGAGPGTDAVV
jgi:hypothetical protein